MEQRNERGSMIMSQHQDMGTALPPEQIWAMLTPPQQQDVFRLLVGVCQSLLRYHLPPEPEVTHEQPH